MHHYIINQGFIQWGGGGGGGLSFHPKHVNFAPKKEGGRERKENIYIWREREKLEMVLVVMKHCTIIYNHPSEC